MPKNLHKAKHKPMSEAKKRKLQKWIDWRMARGVKDKGRSKKPALTNYYGKIIKIER